MVGEARQTGTRDTHEHLVSVLYHLLKGASTAQQFIQDAELAGDAELVQFLRDWQDEQRNLAERAKNLLGTRLASVEDTSKADTGRKRAASGGRSTAVKSSVNAGVKSGGSASDDSVDEASKESFPASDSPATY